MNCSQKGAVGEMIACNYFISLGYEVFRNVVSSGPADLSVWSPITNELFLVDVKTSTRFVKADGSVSYSCQDKREEGSIVKILMVYSNEVLGFLEDIKNTS